MTEKLLTLDEVCDQVRLSPDSVRRSVRAGRLRASKLGGRLRFRQVDVDAYIDAQQVTPTPVAPRRRGEINGIPTPPSRVPPKTPPLSFTERAKRSSRNRAA